LILVATGAATARCSISICTTIATGLLSTQNFVVVHINIGHFDANLDIAEKYQVPLHKGVPALAVLSDRGALLYSQKNGEFEAMRSMESSSLTSFLVQWRPERPGCSAVVVNC
jgi:thioredoxin 1